MKVVVAIDSLKNSLTSVEAGRAIEAGVRKAYGGHPVQVIVKPLADGGEGTVEALVDGLNGQLRYVGVQGPLGEAVSCPYGYLPGMETAVIEMAGAAGGMGFAFLAYLNGRLRSGIQIVLDSIRLADAVKDADYVIAGEGRLDAQTAMGKAPIGVAKLAKQYGAKVIALAGCTTADAAECNRQGIDAFFSIVDKAMPLEEAMNKETALRNMTNTAQQVFNLIRAVS